MTSHTLGAAVGCLLFVAMACGGSGSTGGGNPPGCPAAAPAGGGACSSPGLACSYGCATTATCQGQTWSVSESNIRCSPDAGDGSAGSACSSNGQCSGGNECSPGGTPVGCGICAMPQNPCSTDADCKTIHDAAPPEPMVCGPGGPCVCGVGGKSGSCIPACQKNGDCGPDEACGAGGHCVAKPCASDSDCAPIGNVDYACSAGTCGPKSCSTDADCGGHYCVNGGCYAQPGACTPPAA